MDSEPKTITIDVTAENDQPTVSDNETLIDEDTTYTFTSNDFSKDYADVDGDSMVSVTITALPGEGSLMYGGAPVQLGVNNTILVADIGKLVFTPDEHESGDSYAALKFTVNDGTEDSAEQTYAIDVEAVADAPELFVEMASLDGSALYDISQGGIVSISAEYFAVNAGYENSHGFYVADINGDPIGGVVIQDNAKDGTVENVSFNTSDYPGGVTLGFFIIPDGDTQNAGLEDGDQVTFQNIGGTWTPFVNGVALDGAQQAPAYFSDMSLNPDGFDHFDDTGADGNQNWEDLWNGGDQDNSDVNVMVTLEVCDLDAEVEGNTETPIALSQITSMLVDQDGSETLMLSILDIPDGVELMDGGGNSFTASAGNNSADITAWDWSTLSVVAPTGQDDFVLQVEAKATEGSNNDVATTLGTISVDILDEPGLPTEPEEPTTPPNGYTVLNGFGTNDQLEGDENQNYINGRGGNDKIDGNEPADILIGSSGNDNISGGDGNDELFGGSGNDNVDGDDGDDVIVGGTGLDTLNGGDGKDTIFGGSDKDTINGGDDNDILFGGTGNDIIRGGAGNDIIIGGRGNDNMLGQDGSDTFRIEATFALESEEDDIDGGTGASWIDKIDMSAVAGEYGTDWVVVLDGNVDPEPVPAGTELELGQDAAGEIQFTQGGSITFENVEKIVW